METDNMAALGSLLSLSNGVTADSENGTKNERNTGADADIHDGGDDEEQGEEEEREVDEEVMAPPVKPEPERPSATPAKDCDTEHDGAKASPIGATHSAHTDSTTVRGSSVSPAERQLTDEELKQKVCMGCDMCALDLTAQDIAEGSRTRGWALKHFWGHLCIYCMRMARVRYSWLKTQGLQKFLEQPENKVQFKVRAMSFLSLREEGRVQLTAVQIDNRAQLLTKFSHMIRPAVDSQRMQYLFASDIDETLVGNPVSMQCECVQMRSGREFRIGFAVPTPHGDQRSCLPPNVVVKSAVITECDEDLKAVERFAALARQEQEQMAQRAECVRELDFESKAASSINGSEIDGASGGDARLAKLEADGGAPTESPPELDWPRHKLTKPMKNMQGKIQGMLLNLAQGSWEKAVTANTLRTNVKVVLEREVQLSSCEFEMMIEQNKKQKDMLLLLQKFKAATAAYQATPTDSALLGMFNELESVRALVSGIGKKWYVTLEKMYLHAKFLDTADKHGIKLALESLRLDDPACEIRSMYATLCAELPDTKPARALDWVEGCLVEIAAKHCLRKLAMTPITRDDDLKSMQDFFSGYCAGILPVEAYSAVVKKRARALLALAAAAAGEPISASDIDQAYKVFTLNAKDDLSKALPLYKAGAELLTHAETVVTRHAGDVIADKSLSDVVVRLGFPGGNEEDAAINHLGVLQERAEIVDVLGTKLNEAFNAWSKVRMEEQLPTLKETLVSIVALPLGYDFGLAHTIVCATATLSVNAENLVQTMVEAQGQNLDEESLNGLRALRGVTLRMATEIDNHAARIVSAQQSVVELVGKRLKQVLTDRRMKLDMTQELEALRRSKIRMAYWSAWVKCILAMLNLALEAEAKPYKTAVEEWQAWQAQQGQNGMDTTLKKPYLVHIMEFAEQREALESLQDQANFDDYKMLPKWQEAVASACVGVLGLHRFAVASLLSRHILDKHCKSKLLDSVNGWVSTSLVRFSSLSSVVAAEQADPLSMFNMLYASPSAEELRVLGTEVWERLKFDQAGATVTDNLSHVQCLTVVQSIVGRVGSGGIVVESLQGTAPGDGIEKGDLGKILEMHSAANTCLLIGAALHVILNKGDNPPDKAIAVECARVFTASLQALKGMATSDCMKAIEHKPYHLSFPRAHFDKWLLVAEAFAAKVCSLIVGRYNDLIQAGSAELQMLIPQWEALITDERMNDATVKKTVMSLPQGKLVDQANRLHALLADASKASAILGMSPKYADDETCAGVAALAGAAIKRAFDTMSIVAACNAVINFAGKANGPQLAKDCLNVYAGIKDFKMPRSLLSRLQDLAAKGDTGSKAKGEVAEDGEESAPPVKKARVAGNQSSSSSAVSRPKRTAKGRLSVKSETT